MFAHGDTELTSKVMKHEKPEGSVQNEPVAVDNKANTAEVAKNSNLTAINSSDLSKKNTHDN